MGRVVLFILFFHVDPALGDSRCRAGQDPAADDLLVAVYFRDLGLQELPMDAMRSPLQRRFKWTCRLLGRYSPTS